MRRQAQNAEIRVEQAQKETQEVKRQAQKEIEEVKRQAQEREAGYQLEILRLREAVGALHDYVCSPQLTSHQASQPNAS